MSITSLFFFVFLIAGACVYYIIPGKAQWVFLLGLSIFFCLTNAAPRAFLLPAISAAIAYFAGLFMDKCRRENKGERWLKFIALTAIISEALIWFVFKGGSYINLGFRAIQKVLPSFPLPGQNSLIPALGMGYYTAQVIGYIIDVWWGNAEVQKNPLKLLLFVTFFPQLTVGPISRYNDLSVLYEKHRFSYKNLCFGSQRILWGLFKKIVLADRLGTIINGIWADTVTYPGIWPWIAVLLYPIQIYADFSGCMDIVLGAAEIFDIHLMENFRTPFFSRSVKEFWQRWHMTLGSWARDYVFYPLLKNRKMVRLGKWCRKKFGKQTGKLIPQAIASAVLWFVMGFWHGSVQHIIGVGLWFWALTMLGELLFPLTEKLTRKFGMKTESFGWHLFQSLRTYLLFALGVVFFSAEQYKDGITRFRILLSAHKAWNPWTFFDGTVLTLGTTWKDINLLLFSVLLLLLVGILQEKFGSAREWMSGQPFLFRWFIWLVLFEMVLVFGLYGPGFNAEMFIYQGF